MKINKIYISLFLKLLIVFAVVIGIFSTGATSQGFMSGTMFLYFTIQSNLWIGSIALVFAIFDIIKIFGKNIEIPCFLYIIKYIFTVAISVTFVVFSVMLTPQMIASGNASYLLTSSNIFAHNIAPILAIIDYLIFDKLNKQYSMLYGAIMPLYYLVFSLVLSVCGVEFAEGVNVPYFFLNYSEYGWFRITNNSLGVFYWIMIVVGIVLLISYALKKIKHRIIIKNQVKA